MDHRFPIAAIGQDGKLLIEFFSFQPSDRVVEKIQSGEKYFGWLGQSTPHIFVKVNPTAYASGVLTNDSIEDCYLALLNFDGETLNTPLPSAVVKSIQGRLEPGGRITGHLQYDDPVAKATVDLQFDVTLAQ